MPKKKISESQKKEERNPKKIEKVLKEKGVKSGKLSKGKTLHHVKPVAEGGKTTNKNTRIVSASKHKQIHKNRAKKGKV
jgi:hypothetical protein